MHLSHFSLFTTCLFTEQDVPCVAIEQRAHATADVTTATRSGGIVETSSIDVGYRTGQNLDIHVYFNHVHRGLQIFFLNHSRALHYLMITFLPFTM